MVMPQPNRHPYTPYEYLMLATAAQQMQASDVQTTPFAPDELSGLALWLKPSTGLFQDSAGTVPAAVSDPIGRWEDQSGANNHVLQAIANQKPTRAANGIIFDGIDDSLDVMSVLGIADGQARSLFMRFALANTTLRQGIFGMGQAGSGGSHIALEANTAGSVGNRLGLYVTESTFDSTAVTTTDTQVVSVIMNTTTSGSNTIVNTEYRVGGQLQMLTLRIGGGTFISQSTFNAVRVGGFPGVGSLRLNGVVFEVIVYGRALASTERTQVENYLGIST